MTREQARMLLGGYAAGVLTPEEQEALYAAALEDQELFNELAREQAVHDLLADPAARSRLLNELSAPRAAWNERLSRWLAGHAVGLACAASLVGVVGYVAWQIRPSPDRIRMIAEEPTRVEVSGDSEKPAGARKSFDVASIPKQATPRVVLPPPPAIPRSGIARGGALPDAVAALSPKPVTEPEPVQTMAMSVQEAKALAAGQPAASAFTAPPPADLARSDEARIYAATTQERQALATRLVIQAATQPKPLLQWLGYRVLRRTPEGVFEPSPETTFASGDFVKLEFVLARAGELSVEDTATGIPLIAPATLQGRVVSGEVRLSAPGSRQFAVRFIPSGAVQPAARRADAQAAQSSSGGPVGTAVITLDVK